MKPDNENAYLKLEIVTTAVEIKLTEHRSSSDNFLRIGTEFVNPTASILATPSA